MGISEEAQKTLFVHFQHLNTAENRVGLGIGLAFCKNIVDMMGGAITVKSKKGSGSAFKVVIPVQL